ncbi:MAG: tetratricopeptide repeat protein [Ectothiorhodospiraceae bacterium]|nr:tetratricopeptide repeat protein [Ectothiorhodospiraceae bacterium]MCH8504514.1 tetratricopeptide repeat protein [Ectothiorhodospiraceae bacterium]
MASNQITPYWHQLPAFFRYPLRRPALDMLGITVAVGVIPLALGFAFFAIICSLVMLFMLLKYGYESLMYTASGEMDPPELRDALSGEGYALPLKQLGVIICLFVAVGMVGSVHPILFLLLLVAATLLLPASVIVLAIERSFFAAVNPVRLSQVALGIGWPYLGLFGLVLCVQIATGTASHLLAYVIPPDFHPLLYLSGAVFVGNYFTLMTFHMLGYTVFQYHEELDYPIDVSLDGSDPELALFEELMEAQNYKAALVELRSLLDRDPGNPEYKQRLLRLARLTGDADVLRKEGPAAIRVLVRGGRAQDATDVYLDCLQADPQFRLDAADAHDAVARELRQRGRLREALHLLNGFHQRFPNHPLVPKAYLLAARMFLDDAGKPEQARKLIGYLQKHHPDSPYTSEVDSLARSIA